MIVMVVLNLPLNTVYGSLSYIFLSYCNHWQYDLILLNTHLLLTELLVFEPLLLIFNQD